MTSEFKITSVKSIKVKMTSEFKITSVKSIKVDNYKQLQLPLMEYLGHKFFYKEITPNVLYSYHRDVEYKCIVCNFLIGYLLASDHDPFAAFCQPGVVHGRLNTEKHNTVYAFQRVVNIADIISCEEEKLNNILK